MTVAVTDDHVKNMARAVRGAAEFNITRDAAKWCELISATLSNKVGEIEQTLTISSTGVLTKKRGEIVRFYLNVNDPSGFTPICNAIQMALIPFVVCGRQLVVHDAAEGFIISLADHGQV